MRPIHRSAFISFEQASEGCEGVKLPARARVTRNRGLRAYFYFTFHSCIIPIGVLSWENRVAFPGESQLRRSRVLVSVSVFMSLSTVFYSINSPANSPLSHSVLPVLFLPYWSFELCISL